MKFSFVVIANNQINTICNTIDSIVNQSYANLEVIYVDDGSSDGSADFVEKKYISDKRVQVLRHKESKGCVVSRMDGIRIASGDWILLGDGDDTYSLETCAVLLETIRNAPNVNMIGFGVEPVYVGNTEHINRTIIAEKFCEPHLGYLPENKILNILYIEQKKAWNVWNKCYSAGLAKHILDNTANELLITSEDFYINFIACSAVNGYFGIPNRLYNYTIGSGISTAKKLSLPALKRHLTAARCLRLTEEYAKKHEIYELYKLTFDQHERDLIYSFYEKIKLLQENDKPIAAKLLFDGFGVRNVLSRLSFDFYHEYTEIGKHLDIQKLFPFPQREIKTVGMLYHRIYNGGVERVMQLLTPILQNAGYKVVVITNDPINDLDYPLPEDVTHISLGQAQFNRDIEKGYGPRYDALTKCIEDHKIDAVIYHAWLSDALFWDMCAIKHVGAACIIHCHGSFITGLNTGWMHCVNSAPIFRHADAVAALSEVDRYFWSFYNPNVFTVNSPPPFRPSDIIQSKQNNHNVIWTGHFDPAQNNPYDILHIFSQVVKSVPDAKLYLVGSGTDDVVNNMYRLTDELELADHVVFTGYVEDVGPYLQDAAVYLLTSDFEGYSISFAEALSYGLPIVTYPLPYMTIAKDSAATIQVGWKDIDSAANALIDLLSNDDRRRVMGQIARDEAISYENKDYSLAWKHIFSSLEQDSDSSAQVPSPNILDAYQKTVKLGFDQMGHRIHTLASQCDGLTGNAFDYKNMSKIKRWIAYLLYDRGTLKSIIKYRINTLLQKQRKDNS